MRLIEISIRDFQCYEVVDRLPLHRLGVFIGENDAGKTVLLEAIEVLVTNRAVTPQEHRLVAKDMRADTVTLSGTFLVEPFDKIPTDYLTNSGKYLSLKKVFGPSGFKCYVECLTFEDERLSTFGTLNAPEQKEILEKAGQDPGPNKDSRQAQFDALVSQGAFSQKLGFREIRFSDIHNHLPQFEYISSSDYQQPDSMVQKTLRTALNNCIKPIDPETNEQKLLPELVEAKTKIESALDSKIKEASELIRRNNTKVVNTKVESNIDFSRSLASSNLLLDIGNGLQFVDSFGEGTKKKLWMSLLEWDRITQREVNNTSIIRAYDEPDVNLDYNAERQLFSNILELTSGPDSRIQSFVSTHSMTLVDRAPAQSIYLISGDSDGCRVIDYIKGDTDQDLEAFLTSVGRSVGITNSALFYERAFLVVEGESEENALPILYKNLYSKSLIEDGIVLVNLKTCGAWSQILRILLRNKSHITMLMLDQDVNDGGSGVHISQISLERIGFPKEFLENNCFFIGNKEFEDAFSSEDIAACLNLHWPKQTGQSWEDSDIDALRSGSKKFSNSLMSLVYAESKKHVSKPTLALRQAEYCKFTHQVPAKVIDTFNALRTAAGIRSIEQTPMDASNLELRASVEASHSP